MATNTAGNNARQLPWQTLHYIRKGFTFADDGNVLTVGVIPAGSQIIPVLSGVYVREAFNAGSGNVLDIGNSANDDLYATNLALGTVAFVVIDEAATATDVNGHYVSSATTITATVDLTGTAATTGAAEVIIFYVPDNDQ